MNFFGINSSRISFFSSLVFCSSFLLKRRNSKFLCFDFRFSVIFLFSFSLSKSVLLKIRIIFAEAFFMNFFDSAICVRSSMISKIRSVLFRRFLSWFGKGWRSSVWI